MATLTKFYCFVEDLSEEKHNLSSDVLTVALVAAANAPSLSNTVLANLTQIAYTYCSSRVLSIISSGQTTGLYKLILSDLTLTASGGSVGPFRYIIVFNDTAPNDELIGYLDYGSDLTLADGESLTLDFSPTNGAIQIT